MSQKKGGYLPSKKLNPLHQEKRLSEMDKALDSLKKTIDALSKSHDIHISYLGNFAKHDVKNSIQSMDSILSTNTLNELTEDHLISLKTNLKVIRETMDNFSKLIPYSQDETFSLNSLLSALELLNRSIFFDKKIVFIRETPKDTEIRFRLPFQSILQMFNNLIINSIKSLENRENAKIFLKATIGDFVEISILDNGIKIEQDQVDKIFNFGYSTTGGSGIGLYHARYLCDLFEGSIKIELLNDDEYTKGFTISLPIRKIIKE